MTRDSRPPSLPARRLVLRGLALAGGLTLAGRAATAASAAHLGLLDLAATIEAVQVSFYQTVLEGATFSMDADATDRLREILATERQHLDLLSGLGGRAATGPFTFPAGLTTDASVFVYTGHTLEAVSSAAYLVATREFAALGQPDLAAVAARLAASETQHQGTLSQLSGLRVQVSPLAGADLRRMSDALPLLAGFLPRGAPRSVG